jgi:hypothetical protein
MQRSEGELGLGLDSARRQDVHVGGSLAGVFEQRRLTDAGLSRSTRTPLCEARAAVSNAPIWSRSTSRP